MLDVVNILQDVNSVNCKIQLISSYFYLVFKSLFEQKM